jgi:protein-tyrosine phosphatase
MRTPLEQRPAPARRGSCRGRTLVAVHIRLVCSANICRSPSAALVFAEHLRRAGPDAEVRVPSAGTTA